MSGASPGLGTSTYEHADVAETVAEMIEDRVRRIVDADDPEAAWAWRDPNTLLWQVGKGATARVRTEIRKAITVLARPAGAPRNKMGRVGFSDGVERVLAQEIGVLSSWVEDWDHDDHMVQTPDGVFDLAAGNLRSTGLNDLNLMCTRVAPMDVATPFLDAKVLEMMHGDPEMRDYLLDALAFGLIGAPCEAAFFMLVGGTGTGKSKLLEFMVWLLGSYATSITPRVFAASGARFEEYQVAWLRQKRFVICSEPDDNAMLNEAVVKRISGGDEDTARQIRGTPFRYRPKCTVFMAMNEPPRLTRGGSAIRRRVRLVSMDAPPATEDPFLLDKMKAEAEGFLWQLCQRAGRYLATRTLATPVKVVELSKAYAASASAVEPWVEAELVVTGHTQDFLSTADAFKRFRTWCGVNDYAGGELTVNGFAMRVQHALNRKLVGHYGATTRVMKAGVRRLGFPKVVLRPETNPDTGEQTGAPFNASSDEDPFA